MDIIYEQPQSQKKQILKVALHNIIINSKHTQIIWQQSPMQKSIKTSYRKQLNWRGIANGKREKCKKNCV